MHAHMYVLITGGMAITNGVSSFGIPPNPIFLDNLACDGTESSILLCPRSLLGLHQCDHSQDVAVQCFGKEVRFILLHDYVYAITCKSVWCKLN